MENKIPLSNIMIETPSEEAKAKKTFRKVSSDDLQNKLAKIKDESLQIFHVCIQRARSLILIHEAAHGTQARPEAYLADAFRASIVLSVSALDAFVRSFIARWTDSMIRDTNHPLPSVLVDRIRSFIKDDALLEASRKGDLADRFAKALEADFEKKSFQGCKNILEIFKLLGINDIFSDVAKHTNKNYDILTENVEKFTKRRHLIAHRGDLKEFKTFKEEKITKPDAEECIELMTVIAEAIVKLFERKAQ